MSKRTTIALDAGHGMNTRGKRCLKRIDKNETREWYLNDRIADKVQAMLEPYECTVIRTDDTTGKKDIGLSNRVKAANNAKADIFVSIHHNAGINGGSGGGTVVYYYSRTPVRQEQAQRLYSSIVIRTGLVGNRSQKVINNGFYVIKHTNMPAFLIENGFMDSRTDTPKILTVAHAEKTAQGIVAFLAKELSLKKIKNYISDSVSSVVIYGGLDYSPVFDAAYYAGRYKDLKSEYGDDAKGLFTHFIAHGMKEGRQAIDTFNVQAYRARYPDLQKAFGNNLPRYYQHYIQLGIAEQRKAL